MIVYPNGDGSHGVVTIDSSPQIMRLEREHTGRSIVPTDRHLLIDAIIEDFGDEWVTKAMYHYRWAYQDGIDKAGKLLPLSGNLQLDSDGAQMYYDFFTQRQIGRRELVGSTDITQPIIESSYERLLDLMTAGFAERDFFLGDRPGRGDFGIFGQLTQQEVDPTSVRIAEQRAPKVINWVDRTDDLSWLPVEGDGGWVSLSRPPPPVAFSRRSGPPMSRSCSPTPMRSKRGRTRSCGNPRRYLPPGAVCLPGQVSQWLKWITQRLPTPAANESMPCLPARAARRCSSEQGVRIRRRRSRHRRWPRELHSARHRRP